MSPVAAETASELPAADFDSEELPQPATSRAQRARVRAMRVRRFVVMPAWCDSGDDEVLTLRWDGARALHYATVSLSDSLSSSRGPPASSSSGVSTTAKASMTLARA